MNETLDRPIYLSNCEAITALGVGSDAVIEELLHGVERGDRTLEKFKPAPLLTDRKMLKAISKLDGIGLAAVELLNKSMEEPQDPFRRGMFLGSPFASPFANENYMEAQAHALSYPQGEQVKEFGKASMAARPNTLLTGLPNNVLCYGSMVLNAMGDNNNYTALDVSSYLALAGGIDSLRRGESDEVIFGGYSNQNNPVYTSVSKKRGFEEDRYCEGAVVGLLSCKEAPIEVLACTHASTGAGPFCEANEIKAAVSRCIERALDECGMSRDEIALGLLHQPGDLDLNEAEYQGVLQQVASHVPIGTLTPGLGDLCEAGGILDLYMSKALLSEGRRLPDLLSLRRGQAGAGKRCFIVTRLSHFGEVSCVVGRVHA